MPFQEKITKFKRNQFLTHKRRKLKNKNFSIIASNCIGGIILHDLNLPFNSPFINLWIKPKDFIKLLVSLENYMSKELTFVKEEGINYPIGLLGDVKIYFQHYSSQNEALEKWNSRKKRINYDNLYVFFTDRDGCTKDDLIFFDQLPYHKIVFTNKRRRDITSAYYIKGFQKEECVGMLMDFMPKKKWKRYIDQFDYVRFFNKHIGKQTQRKVST